MKYAKCVSRAPTHAHEQMAGAHVRVSNVNAQRQLYYSVISSISDR